MGREVGFTAVIRHQRLYDEKLAKETYRANPLAGNCNMTLIVTIATL